MKEAITLMFKGISTIFISMSIITIGVKILRKR